MAIQAEQPVTPPPLTDPIPRSAPVVPDGPTGDIPLLRSSFGVIAPTEEFGDGDSSVDPFGNDRPAAFTFEKLLAIGGFGEIWESNQCSLSRIVAIKRIRRDLMERALTDPALLRRYEVGFRQEALITASLEHPNIVPIHDMGLDEDGLPLLAMKLVRGKPWDKLIADEFGLSVPTFLQRHLPIFASVCQAVAFAHSKGVLHRDLKPSQIIVAEFGEVQLMDWGIAVRMSDLKRLVESGDAAAQAAINPSGTAAFMAPEQTERTVARLGPHTDVFLLGGTLYYLLTGRVPHGSTTANGAFYEASRCEIVSPQLRNPHREIPAELADLAMDAMARDIDKRIQTAEEFLTRLQDYITGESKRREAAVLVRKVEKVLETRPTGYGDLTVCQNQLDQALVLWPESGRIHDLRDRTRALYAASAIEHGDLTLARMNATRLPDGPERADLINRIDAAERIQQENAERLRLATSNARDLLDFILLDLHGSLRQFGRLDLLEKAALKVFAHFEAFPETAPDEASYRSRCHALRNIADVFKEKARLESALQALREAVRLAEIQNRLDPNKYEWIEDLSDSWDKMAAVYYELGDLDSALKYNNRGLHLRELLSHADASRIDWRSRLAWSYHQEGMIYWRKGHQQEALADLEESSRLRRLILEEQPQDFGEGMALAYTLNGRIWVHRALGDIDSAMADAEESLVLRRGFAARRPDSLACVGDVAWSLKSMALLLEDRMEIERALGMFREALVMCQRLSDSDPSSLSRRMELAFCHGGIARMEHLLGNLAEAEAAYVAAVALHGPAVEQEFSNGRDLRDHLYNLTGLSACQLDAGKIVAARETAERGLKWGNELMRRTRENPSFVEARARVLVQIGRVEAACDDMAAAERHWSEAAEAMLPFFREGEYPAAQEETLAVALLLLGRKDEAGPWVNRLMRKNWGGREFLRLLSGNDHS
ncbi:protein kinase [bacterium]|nr:protein kinase [bacterium]